MTDTSNPDPSTSAAKPVAKVRTCAYAPCGKSFEDNVPRSSRKYCSSDCTYRAKQERSGKVSGGGFLADRKMMCARPGCGVVYTPKRANQVYCSDECSRVTRLSDKPRDKTCRICNLPFTDTSSKNNQRAHPECSRQKWGHKDNPASEPNGSFRLGQRRRNYTLTGNHGRVDDIRTMRKFTHSWWGRVSELIYAAYNPKSEDMNAQHGNRSPFDFRDPKLGRVDIRGAKGRLSPQGRTMWAFSTSGLKESCDTAILVGYSPDQTRVEHIWQLAATELEANAMRMAPGSGEYHWADKDVIGTWGIKVGNEKLEELRNLPEPVKPEDRFAWMSDPTNFQRDDVAWHRGRRGEFFYQGLHPDSKDMNRAMGAMAPYDFEDADGTKVNVKSGKRHPRHDSPATSVWTFSLLSRDHQAQGRGHKCDVYSCLCLDEQGAKVLREYRIPQQLLVGRRTIHIYEEGGQWQPFRVERSMTIAEVFLSCPVLPEDAQGLIICGNGVVHLCPLQGRCHIIAVESEGVPELVITRASIPPADVHAWLVENLWWFQGKTLWFRRPLLSSLDEMFNPEIYETWGVLVEPERES